MQDYQRKYYLLNIGKLHLCSVKVSHRIFSHLYGYTGCSPVQVTDLQASNLYQRPPSFSVFCILWFKALTLHVISYRVHPSSFGPSSFSLPHYL